MKEKQKQERYDKAYLRMAQTWSSLSHCSRKKVGAIIVKDGMIISDGYNGTPAGWENSCEEVVEVHEDGGVVTKTKDEVIHAEANAIGKLARSSESGINATMYLTHSPCFDCAKLIHVAGINKVFYRTQYRNTDGIEFLNKCNIEVEKI